MYILVDVNVADMIAQHAAQNPRAVATVVFPPPGGVGHVRVQTPTMVRSYIGDPRASAKAFSAGWYYPGDLGTLSGEGGKSRPKAKSDAGPPWRGLA